MKPPSAGYIIKEFFQKGIHDIIFQANVFPFKVMKKNLKGCLHVKICNNLKICNNNILIYFINQFQSRFKLKKLILNSFINAFKNYSNLNFWVFNFYFILKLQILPPDGMFLGVAQKIVIKQSDLVYFLLGLLIIALQ